MERLKRPSGLDPAVFWPSVAVAGGFVAWGTLAPDSLAADEAVRRIYLGTDFRLD